MDFQRHTRLARPHSGRTFHSSAKNLVPAHKHNSASRLPQNRNIENNNLALQSERIYRNHLFETFKSLDFCRQLPPVNSALLREKTVNLPRRPGYEGKKTIVFDLDETLVHSLGLAGTSPEVILPIRYRTGEVQRIGLNIRPHALECLRQANKDFEVILFTASHKDYADAILEHLDPHNELLHHRLYRDSCLLINGTYIKDLRILSGRRLKDIVIIDNCAHSYAYQLENAVPIISWVDDKEDKELLNLVGYMKRLARARDIREVNSRVFGLRTFCEDYMKEFYTV